MNKLKLLIKGHEKETFSIHYSCECFYNGGTIAPAICSITMTNLKNNESKSFAIHDYFMKGNCLIDSEKHLLEDFIKFYNTLKNPILVHWNMMELCYGFKALTARCENYGLYNLNFSNSEIINFCDFVYKNLYVILETYNCGSPYILSGKDEASCFDKKNFNAVKLSTEAKSLGLVKLLNLVLVDKIFIKDSEEKVYED